MDNNIRINSTNYNHEIDYMPIRSNQIRRNYSYLDDSLELSTKQKPKKKKKNLLHDAKVFLTGSIATIGTAAAISVLTPAPSASVKEVYDRNTSIEELSDNYGVSQEAIIKYNNLDVKDEFPREIIIPSDYDYIEDEIAKLQEHLYSGKLSDEEKAETIDKINALKEKKSVQDEVAIMYTDGKYVYFTLKDDAKSMNIEDFKELFDIKDGALRKNNEIAFEWEEDEYGGYKDYTYSTVYPNETLKVKPSQINKNKINLDYDAD